MVKWELGRDLSLLIQLFQLFRGKLVSRRGSEFPKVTQEVDALLAQRPPGGTHFCQLCECLPVEAAFACSQGLPGSAWPLHFWHLDFVPDIALQQDIALLPQLFELGAKKIPP